MMNLMHGDVERLGWLDPRSVGGDFPLKDGSSRSSRYTRRR